MRAWGLSNETSFGVMSHCAASFALGVPPPVTLQNHYSLLQRTYEGDLAETCHNLGIGLLPWSPLAGGCGTMCGEVWMKVWRTDLAKTCHNYHNLAALEPAGRWVWEMWGGSVDESVEARPGQDLPQPGDQTDALEPAGRWSWEDLCGKV